MQEETREASADFPRLSERYAIRRGEDGQLQVDKARKFQRELGQWDDPDSYILL